MSFLVFCHFLGFHHHAFSTCLSTDMIRCLGNRKFRFVVWRIGRVFTEFYLHLRFGQRGHEGELERNVSQKIPKVFNYLNFLLEISTPLYKLIESVVLAILRYFLPWD